MGFDTEESVYQVLCKQFKEVAIGDTLGVLNFCLEVSQAKLDNNEISAIVDLIVATNKSGIDKRTLRARCGYRKARAAVLSDVITDQDVIAQLVMSGGENPHPTPCQSNVNVLLRYYYNERITFDSFNQEVLLDNARITDGDYCAITERISKGQSIGFSISHVVAAVQMVARESGNIIDSCDEWARSLVWDGIPRVDTWLEDYCTVVGTPTTRDFGRVQLLASARRALAPVSVEGRFKGRVEGAKVDTMLVMVGSQGTMKSRTIELFASAFDRRAFTALGVKVMEHKDAPSILHGKLCVEVSEMESMYKHDTAILKTFVSTTVDRYRPPYAKEPIDAVRRCVFWGTSNDTGEGVFGDTTGSRRYMPVYINGEIDYEGLEKVVNQLWAEAVHRVLHGEDGKGEQWWLKDSKAQAEHNKEFDREIDYKAQEMLQLFLDEPEDFNARFGLGLMQYKLLESGAVEWVHCTQLRDAIRLATDSKENEWKQSNNVNKLMKQIGYSKVSVKVNGTVIFAYRDRSKVMRS